MTKKHFYPTLIFFVSLVKTVLFSNIGFGLVDQGESLHNARRILAGDLPYRDFFTIFPPGDNYYYAFIFKIFGEGVLAPRIVSSIIFSAGLVFLFLFLQKHSTKFHALLAPLLLIFVDTNAERLFFLAPIFVALHLYDKDSRVRIFVAGLLVGLSSLVRIDIPGVFAVGLVLYLLEKQKRWTLYSVYNVFWFVLGYAMVLSLPTYLMIKNAIFVDFLQSNIDALVITKLHNLPFPSISQLFPSSFGIEPLSVAFVALFGNFLVATYTISGISLINKTKSRWVFPLLISGVLALPYVFGRSDLGHFVKGGIPALILSGIVAKNWKSFRAPVYLALGFLFVGSVIQTIWWVNFNDTRKIIVGENLIINSKIMKNSTAASADTIAGAVSFLRDNSQKGEKVLALPYMAGIYYLADREPPGGFNNLLAGYITNTQDQLRYIELIEYSAVDVVVYDPNNGPKMRTSRLSQYNRLVHDYLLSNFAVTGQTSDGWLLMKKI